MALEHVAPVDPVAAPAAEQTRRDSSAPSSEPPSEAPSESPSEPPSEAPSASRPATSGVPEGPLTLALAPDGTLLRATLGGCDADSDPSVAVSTNGGARFRKVPVADDLDAVMAVEADGRGDLVVVGADGDCTASAYAGAAPARTWQAGPAEPYWHLMFATTDAVHAPGGIVETPCTPQALSTVGAVRLLCEEGQVLGTSDGGESWVTLGRLDEATAFAFEGPSRGYALVSRGACPATVMTTSDGGASWQVSHCLDGAEGRAIAARGDAVTALVDDGVWRSEDAGATWTQVTP
jgi:photosystem II stability/assembly factor-like uncharacterized protein